MDYYSSIKRISNTWDNMDESKTLCWKTLEQTNLSWQKSEVTASWGKIVWSTEKSLKEFFWRDGSALHLDGI